MLATKRNIAATVGLLAVGFAVLLVASYLRPAPDQGVTPAPARSEAQPEPVWRPPVLDSVPAGTVSHPSLVVSAPQTYEVAAEVLGYENAETGVVCLTLGAGRLIGSVDAKSGKESGTSPSDSGPDYATDLEGVTVLAGTTARARQAFTPSCTIRLILLPVGDGVTLYVDSVEGEVTQ